MFCVPYKHNYTIFDENIIFNFYVIMSCANILWNDYVVVTWTLVFRHYKYEYLRA